MGDCTCVLKGNEPQPITGWMHIFSNLQTAQGESFKFPITLLFLFPFHDSHIQYGA